LGTFETPSSRILKLDKNPEKNITSKKKITWHVEMD
jgi:hypothetical protein